MAEAAKTTNLGTMTPRRAIRHYCLDRCGSAAAVKDCGGDTLYFGPCKLYPYRMGRGRPSVKLIRKNCLWCMGGSAHLVRKCPSRSCPLLAYRFGTNPKMTRKKLSPDELQELRERAEHMRKRAKSVKTTSPRKEFRPKTRQNPQEGSFPRPSARNAQMR